MRNLTCALVCYLLSAPAFAVDWSSLINQNGGAKVYFGVAIEGPDPYQRNFSDSFAPASTAKLFTAGALLSAFGPEFRYATEIRYALEREGVASHVKVIGNGDPSWGLSELGEGLSTRVNLLADMLQGAGIQAVRNVDFVAADTRLDEISFPIGWKSSDPLGCGGAIGQSFNLNINCATLVVSGTTRAAWREPGVPTPVQLNIRPGSSTSISVKLQRFESGILGYELSGTYKSGTRSFYLPVWNTRAWVKNLFLSALKQRGIELLPRLARPARAPEFSLVSHSPALPEILKPFLKNSVNLLGDSLLKTLAQTEEMPLERDLRTLGLLKLRDYLLSLGVPDEFVLYDGSGLSRLSRISPRAMLAFLQGATRSGFPALWNGLPIAGIDGTLRNRMKGTAAAGVLRAKTGTLDGVYNLAGWVPDGGTYVPFLMLTKTSTSYASTSRAAQNRVGARLAQLLKATAPAEEIVPFPYVPEHAGMDDQ